MATDTSRYQRFFSTTGFWKKIAARGKSVGRSVLANALYLYYAVQNERTPKWAKRVIYGALGYFIFPLDMIPDLAPFIGYTDDASVLAAALATVAVYITPEVKSQAHEKLAQWFEPDTPTSEVSPPEPPHH